jgi:hypothetical protein
MNTSEPVRRRTHSRDEDPTMSPMTCPTMSPTTRPRQTVTLPAPVLDRLLAEAADLGVSLEWAVAAFVAALRREAGR